MTNEEILKKVIVKAIKNGWNKRNVEMYTSMSKEPDSYEGQNNKEEWNPVEAIYRDYFGYESEGLFAMIFSHDFAKAFWGEEEVPMNYKSGNNKEWKYHLQQMVLEEEPIKYLEQFI